MFRLHIKGIQLYIAPFTTNVKLYRLLKTLDSLKPTTTSKPEAQSRTEVSPETGFAAKRNSATSRCVLASFALTPHWQDFKVWALSMHSRHMGFKALTHPEETAQVLVHIFCL
jgi:hypothetical protein